MTENTNSFPGRLKLLREHQRLSKSALGRAIGVTTTCVWNWEKGNTEPRSENLRALSEALNAPVEYLQSGSQWEGAPSDGTSGKHSSSSLTLPEVIADAKVRIAEIAGIAPGKVNISLDY